MPVTASIKFTQGPNTDVAGRAVVGTLSSVDGPVTVTNGDNTDVNSWQIILLDAPPSSANYPPGSNPQVLASGTAPAAPSTTFNPDAAGSYRVMLDVVDGSGNRDRDIRCFGVPDGRGFIEPPFQRNPDPLPLQLPGIITNLLDPPIKPDEQNYAGQARGWAGTSASDGQFSTFLSTYKNATQVVAAVTPYAVGVAIDTVLVDTATIAGASVVNLPSTAAVGQTFEVADIGNSADTYNITVNLPGGSTFPGGGSSTTVTVAGGSVRLQKVAASTWLVLGVTGSSGLSGPGSSTDHALARWDGGAGGTLQDSSVLLDDSNHMSGLASLSVGGAPATTGGLRLTYANDIYFRNSGNTVDVKALSIDASPRVVVGSGSNVVRLDVGVSGVAESTGYLAVRGGSTPATNGALRMPNGASLGINFLSTSLADVIGLALNNSNILQLGDANCVSVRLQRALEVDTLSGTIATSGSIRLFNTAVQRWRNAAGSNNVDGIQVTAGDEVQVGGTNAAGVRLAVGASAILYALSSAVSIGPNLVQIGSSLGAVATTGSLRHISGASQYVRDSGNTKNIRVWSHDAGTDDLSFGDTTEQTTINALSSVTVALGGSDRVVILSSEHRSLPATFKPNYNGQNALTGAIGLRNDDWIRARNVANLADVDLLKLNSANIVEVGGAGTANVQVKPGGAARFSVGTSAVTVNVGALELAASGNATVGSLRFPNNSGAYWRNNAGSSNIEGIAVLSDDRVRIGNGSSIVEMETLDYWLFDAAGSRHPNYYLVPGGARTTTTGVQTIITFTGGANQGYLFELSVACKSTSDGESGAWKYIFRGSTTASIMAFSGPPTALLSDPEDGGWGGVTVTTSGADLVVQVEGQAADVVEWSALLKVLEQVPG